MLGNAIREGGTDVYGQPWTSRPGSLICSLDSGEPWKVPELGEDGGWRKNTLVGRRVLYKDILSGHLLPLLRKLAQQQPREA